MSMISDSDFLSVQPSELKFPFTMQAQKEAPPGMQCNDKFQILSVVAPIGATKEDISSETFNREDGRIVQELKLSVGYEYDPANPSIGAKSLKPSSTRHSSSSSEVKIDVSKSAEENNLALLQQSQKLLEELELARKQIAKQQCALVFLILALIVLILHFLVGHLR